MHTLDHASKHLLKLIRQGQNDDGWTEVSEIVFPLIQKLPLALVEWKETSEAYQAKLTHDGNVIVDWV